MNSSQMVVATGAEPSVGGDNWGNGLWRFDGSTWSNVQPVGSWNGVTFGGIGRVERVRWGDQFTVFAAANSGLWRSTDAGVTWAQVFGNSTYNPSTDVIDITVDPVSPARVYITTFTGVFWSGDSGSTWFGLPLPPIANGAAFDVNRIGRGSRMTFGSYGNSTGVYWMVSDRSDPDGALYGVFYSSYYGNTGTWSQVNMSGCSVEPNRKMSFIAINPTNAWNWVVGGEAGACYITSAGVWHPFSGRIHTDYRAATYASNGSLVVGSDGGIYQSNDGGATWYDSGNAVFPAPNNLSYAISRVDSRYRYMANWDVGLWGSPAFSEFTINYGNGDGDARTVYTDILFGMRAFATSGNASFSRYMTSDGGASWVNVDLNLPASTTREPIMRVDGLATPGTATEHVFTSSGAFIFSSVLPDTGGVLATNWSRWPTSTTSAFAGDVETFDVNDARYYPLHIYAAISGATSAHKMYVYQPSSWLVGEVGLPTNVGIRAVRTTPEGTAACAVTYDSRVFKTTNSGGNWQDITWAASSLNVADCLMDPGDAYFNTIFLATPSGVYRGTSSGAWTLWSTGLPFDSNGMNAGVSNLSYYTSGTTTYIVAGVPGRGGWQRDRSSYP
jgi:photosystem II stability/assembly factor-like uncharacterized protein